MMFLDLPVVLHSSEERRIGENYVMSWEEDGGGREIPCEGEKGDGLRFGWSVLFFSLFFFFFAPSVRVRLLLEGWTRARARAVEAACARAADGVALLSGVRLALPLLYRSHCTLYTGLMQLPHS